MQTRGYNERLKHTAEVKAIDFVTKKVKLVQPESDPIFIYEEKLDNVTLLEFTGVTLQGKDIYVGDKLIDDNLRIYEVSKVPGGYLPFMRPNKINFKKVD